MHTNLPAGVERIAVPNNTPRYSTLLAKGRSHVLFVSGIVSLCILFLVTTVPWLRTRHDQDRNKESPGSSSFISYWNPRGSRIRSTHVAEFHPESKVTWDSRVTQVAPIQGSNTFHASYRGGDKGGEEEEYHSVKFRDPRDPRVHLDIRDVSEALLEYMGFGAGPEVSSAYELGLPLRWGCIVSTGGIAECMYIKKISVVRNVNGPSAVPWKPRVRYCKGSSALFPPAQSADATIYVVHEGGAGEDGLCDKDQTQHRPHSRGCAVMKKKRLHYEGRDAERLEVLWNMVNSVDPCKTKAKQVPATTEIVRSWADAERRLLSSRRVTKDELAHGVFWDEQSGLFYELDSLERHLDRGLDQFPSARFISAVHYGYSVRVVLFQTLGKALPTMFNLDVYPGPHEGIDYEAVHTSSPLCPKRTHCRVEHRPAMCRVTYWKRPISPQTQVPDSIGPSPSYEEDVWSGEIAHAAWEAESFLSGKNPCQTDVRRAGSLRDEDVRSRYADLRNSLRHSEGTPLAKRVSHAELSQRTLYGVQSMYFSVTDIRNKFMEVMTNRGGPERDKDLGLECVSAIHLGTPYNLFAHRGPDTESPGGESRVHIYANLDIIKRGDKWTRVEEQSLLCSLDTASIPRTRSTSVQYRAIDIASQSPVIRWVDGVLAACLQHLDDLHAGRDPCK